VIPDERGRITEPSDARSPGEGKGPYRQSSTVGAVTLATAAAPVRLIATALAVSAVVVLLATGRADGAARSWSVYLAPESACASASDPSAPAATQVRAVTCLVNWARAQDRRGRLVPRSLLQRAAAIKGERVAACRQFSHTPCGSAFTAAVKAAGYRYALFGENLFAGTWGQFSARDVVSAWLQSPPHRRTLLTARFRHLGVAPVHASGLLGGSDAVVWTAAFASPR
jgi:uncharacterized protein YkwD